VRDGLEYGLRKHVTEEEAALILTKLDEAHEFG